MKTPSVTMIAALRLEMKLSALYSVMIDHSTKCEVIKSLKLLLKENIIEIDRIFYCLDDFKETAFLIDVPEIIKEEDLVADLKTQITNAKDVFQLAINFEKRILDAYQKIIESKDSGIYDLHLENLIHIKESHINVLKNYLSPKVIFELCRNNSPISYTFTNQSPTSNVIA